MTLGPGTRFGPFEIVVLLGVGGMGQVYRARDSKLKRDVAIKILPDAFAREPERVARFQREAEVLASLNHSNIAAIYDLAERKARGFWRLGCLAVGFNARQHIAADILSDLQPWPHPVIGWQPHYIRFNPRKWLAAF